MPVENEKKYLLNLDILKSDYFKKKTVRKYDITQYYLTNTSLSEDMVVRVRETYNHADKSYHYTLTNKFVIKDYSLVETRKLLEFEQNITSEEYKKIIQETRRHISKTRYVVDPYKFANNYTKIEVDVFWTYKDYLVDVDEEAKYKFDLCIMEVEMYEGYTTPQTIPDWVYPYIKYDIPLGDTRFSNSKLTDWAYMKKMVETFA